MSRPEHVQVWTWHCPSENAALSTQRETLSEQEQARADRFVFPADRARFIAAHAGLRRILGILLGRNAAALAFEETAYGKPHIAGGEHPPLFFNLTHAGCLAGVAVSRSFEIGFDIERVRPEVREAVLPGLTAEERAELLALPREAQIRAATDCWTRKEAFVKAVGLGLSMPLDSFSVSLGPQTPTCVRHVAGDPLEAARWKLVTTMPAPGYVGAIAARSLAWDVRVHRLGRHPTQLTKSEVLGSEAP